MQFVLVNLQNKVLQLIEEINSLNICVISSLQDLKSGIVIRQALMKSIRISKQFLSTKSLTKETNETRWKSIIDFIKQKCHQDLSDFQIDEIQNDSGILLVVCKTILKLIQPPKVHIPGFSVKNSSSKSFFRSTAKFEESSIDEEKSNIHQWLLDMKILPPGMLIHEFLYRIRCGQSLFELLKKLNADQFDAEITQIKTLSYLDCLKNINVLLRFLRKNTTVDKKFLYCSDLIYEGNQTIIYGLLSDIQNYYLKKKNYPRRPLSPQIFRKYSSPKRLASPQNSFSTSVKNSIMNWISSLGLLRYVIYSENIISNSFQNGLLVCEAIKEIFKCEIPYKRSPKSLKECTLNFETALEFLKIKCNFIPEFSQVDDYLYISWEVLYYLMNNSHELNNKDRLSEFLNMENNIVKWLKEKKLITEELLSVFDLVELAKSGHLLAKIANLYFSPKEPISENGESEELIEKSLKIFESNSEMSQRFTQSTLNICNGEITTIINLLEDLYNFSLKFKDIKELSSEKPIYKTVKDIKKWLKKQNIVIFEPLSRETLTEFKDGTKLCEIIQKVCNCSISVIKFPKNNSEALWNIRQGLQNLYRLSNFPLKYQYYDDLILSGHGPTVVSFLLDLLNL